MAKKPLAGVKVVELALMVAGGTCTRMMADWGADVIKVESTGVGDTFRKWPAAVGAPIQDDFNPIFDTLNANKRSISVDMKKPEGQEVMYRLLTEADVFITNVRTEPLKRMGMDYDTLKARFPRLVMGQFLGYGKAGPDKDKPGYDTVAFWARGGFMYSQAVYESKEAYPVYMPMGFGDTVCAMEMMAAVSAALLAARETGEGDLVSCTLYGTAMWVANIMITGTQFGYHYPRTRNLSSPFGAPFLCKDGRWFMPQVVDFSRDVPKYYKLIGVEDMCENPVYLTRANFNKEEINAPVMKRFDEIYASKTSKEWDALFKEADLCSEILYTYEETLEDEQALLNDYVYEMKYDNGKTVKLIRPSIYSKNLGTPPYERGPMLGEQSVELLKSHGYSQADIEALLASGVVKQHD
jgi:crotonobetainyl-CoA:carnitine CoA-transferase CaiB-like acyl-CoA transferase